MLASTSADAAAATRKLCGYMERGLNWRFCGLAMAAWPKGWAANYSAEDVGEAFYYLARNPERKEYHLSRARGAGGGLPAFGIAAPRQQIRPLAYKGADFGEPDTARELAKTDSKFSEKDMGTPDAPGAVDVDKYAGRMLINFSETELDVLWREQLLDTVIQGAEEKKVARDAATVIPVDTRKGDHPRRSDDVFAPKIARGAEIPDDESDYDTVSWSTDKFGQGMRVTEEMVDHALIDVVEDNVRFLGRAAENALNRVWINELVDNADSTNDFEANPTNREVSLDDLNRLVTNIEETNFPLPDTLTIHPKAKQGLLTQEDNNNLTFVNRAGTDDAITSRNVPDLLGMTDAFSVPSSVYNGSNTWDWSSTGEFGAVAYNRDLIGIYLQSEMETKRFDDPIRDLEGANVRAEFDCKWQQNSAAARLKH